MVEILIGEGKATKVNISVETWEFKQLLSLWLSIAIAFTRYLRNEQQLKHSILKKYVKVNNLLATCQLENYVMSQFENIFLLHN